MISIIIPTKNEENYLPLLLDSIKIQNIDNFEIIVADAGSTDRTKHIAQRYGCRIVDGGLPAKGRNNGAEASNGELLIFIDADAILPPDFLEKAVKEFYERNLDVAGTAQNPIGKFNLKNKMIYEVANKYIALTEKFKPHMQICMFARKGIHEKINGFDERLIFAEDSNYAERAGKIGKFGVLKSGRVLASPRRFEGARFFVLKYIYLNLLRIIRHELYEGKSKAKYFE